MRHFYNEPIAFEPQAGAAGPLWRGLAPGPAPWLSFAVAVHRHGGRLATLWGSDERAFGRGFSIHALFGADEGHLWLTLALPAEAPRYPALSGIFPAANRLQRATFDLTGIAHDGADQRPWLRHNGWPGDWFPLRHDAGEPPPHDNTPSDYPFVTVGGEGAHEIPVGPIHAGIIEPGHFRFSVVGERVLRLEQRLGYQHKGVERRFQGMTAVEGARLAGRISGDSTCAYAWAYAAAIEAAAGVAVPARALALRGLLLERERVANHLGDLGMLGNDAALAFGLSQFFRLKEDWVRFSAQLFGHRFMMDTIIPGGVAVDLDCEGALRLGQQCEALAAEVAALKLIYDEHAGLQDRFLTTGTISAELARELSLTGVAARATGLVLDLRSWRQDYRPPAPYSELAVRPVSDDRGDVAARVAVRFDEIFESLRLIRALAERLPAGPTAALVAPLPGSEGAAVVEGWRGEVAFAVAFDNRGQLRRVHPHDPSWQAWPALEFAVLNDIVPDFPLINKSFNLSYSGQDL